jgi:hypothetical protein
VENKPPVANAGEDKPVKAGETVQLDGSASSDEDGEIVSYEWTVVSGAVTLDDPSKIKPTFTAPSVNSETVLVFGLKVTDDKEDQSELDAIRITVIPIGNKPPIANEINSSIKEDTKSSIVLTGSDPEGKEIVYKITSFPKHGKLSTLDKNGKLTYKPDGNYFGGDTFTFIVSDGELDSKPASVNLVISPINDIPIAIPQSVKALKNASKEITLQGTDIEEADKLRYAISKKPSKGTANLIGNTVTYKPNNGYVGVDDFRFIVKDSKGLSSTEATVKIIISVNHLPVAQDQDVAISQNTPINITLVATDKDGDQLSYKIASKPAHGSVGTIESDKVVYRPNIGYIGEDRFTFNAVDTSKAVSTIGIVSVKVSASPHIININPLEGSINQTVILNISGVNLPSSIVANISHQKLGCSKIKATPTTASFTCPLDVVGNQILTLKTATQAKNGVDIDGGNVTFNVFQPILPPTNIKAVSSDGKITLFWDAVQGATSYSICYAPETITDPDNCVAALQNRVSLPNQTSPADITGLTNNTVYHFIVTAEDANKRVAHSNEITATPQVSLVNPSLTIRFDQASLDTLGADYYGMHELIIGRNEGTAAKFYGINNPGHIRIPNRPEIQFTDAATFDMWVRADSSTGMNGWGSISDRSAMSLLAKSHDRSGITIMMTPSPIVNSWFATFDPTWSDANCQVVKSDSNVHLNTWFRITMVASSMEGTAVYINKDLMYTCANARPSFDWSNRQDLYIGKFSDYWYPLDGAIQDINIYKQALTKEQVQALP